MWIDIEGTPINLDACFRITTEKQGGWTKLRLWHGGSTTDIECQDGMNFKSNKTVAQIQRYLSERLAAGKEQYGE